MLIIKTAENSYPSSVEALNELYQFIAVIKNEKMANDAYGLLSAAKNICHQGENLLEAARLAKIDLASHENYIKENKFSARHLRKLKNVAEDLRNDVIKEAWNAYQSFRVCYTIAKSEKKIEAIIKKISKTYDQQQGVAVGVVEDELSKNSHVLGLTEKKLNKILGDMQDAISAYTQQDKAAYYQEIIAQNHPGIVVLALALKNEPRPSSSGAADGKPHHLSLIDNAAQAFIAKVVMPYEEQAKRALEQSGAEPLKKLASSASVSGTVAVGAGAVYVMSKKNRPLILLRCGSLLMKRAPTSPWRETKPQRWRKSQSWIRQRMRLLQAVRN
ncbi:hypothetical protein JZM24_02365 [Candidatus Sodalis endolongispinus]|uniref:Uncharacterized protein n=1 Tax=Candidatus Sodalis endolongispinus TaxID=2812662 RepID=A0ABS5Y8M1_9GAMM|nr:hypothetical protein [Candidatus Sodalis endolongispinus]MBT9431287.1 hypothetical protein [Candidatus Sodalis endolongispinus]